MLAPNQALCVESVKVDFGDVSLALVAIVVGFNPATASEDVVEVGHAHEMHTQLLFSSSLNVPGTMWSGHVALKHSEHFGQQVYSAERVEHSGVKASGM